MRAAIKTVDVFTSTPFRGNPVAVVLDAGGLSAARMQQVAHWMNLSETTFVLPPATPGADYRLRIFTPGGELPFAGHPTIGSAHALLEAGMVAPRDGVLVQECGAGLVRLQVQDASEGARWIAFDLPQASLTALSPSDAAELEAILGVPLAHAARPFLADVGARWVIAQLPDAQAVLDCRPDLARMAIQDRRGRHTGVVIFGPHPDGSPARIETRAFAPAHGVPEDPVCGSGNGAMAAYLRHTGQADHYQGDFLVSQGAKAGRAGVLRLSMSGERIRVGGQSVTCIDGTLNF
ncbi:PhzF family phenazine biosynthesis protein [Massilia sp. DD77]|uniref:PhzF family phenazine biosynthesis protein n=1 Tax=Massilia sp. DD77 TaxID=3109349 RepID=UPI0030007A2D